jgi:hypothetical protein
MVVNQKYYLRQNKFKKKSEIAKKKDGEAYITI